MADNKAAAALIGVGSMVNQFGQLQDRKQQRALNQQSLSLRREGMADARREFQLKYDATMAEDEARQRQRDISNKHDAANLALRQKDTEWREMYETPEAKANAAAMVTTAVEGARQDILGQILEEDRQRERAEGIERGTQIQRQAAEAGINLPPGLPADYYIGAINARGDAEGAMAQNYANLETLFSNDVLRENKAGRMNEDQAGAITGLRMSQQQALQGVQTQSLLMRAVEKENQGYDGLTPEGVAKMASIREKIEGYVADAERDGQMGRELTDALGDMYGLGDNFATVNNLYKRDPNLGMSAQLMPSLDPDDHRITSEPNSPDHPDGMDFAAPMNTPVLSPVAGVVVYAQPEDDGKNAGRHAIIKDNNGNFHHLAHFSETTVKTGDSIDRGDQVGLSGMSGARVTGPHLHYTIRKQGSWRDPVSEPYDYNSKEYLSLASGRQMGNTQSLYTQAGGNLENDGTSAGSRVEPMLQQDTSPPIYGPPAPDNFQAPDPENIATTEAELAQSMDPDYLGYTGLRDTVKGSLGTLKDAGEFALDLPIGSIPHPGNMAGMGLGLGINKGFDYFTRMLRGKKISENIEAGITDPVPEADPYQTPSYKEQANQLIPGIWWPGGVNPEYQSNPGFAPDAVAPELPQPPEPLLGPGYDQYRRWKALQGRE